MKSITTKLSLAMILCMIVAVTLVSVIYMGKTRAINEEDAQKIITLICDESAKALDAQLLAIERTVKLLDKHSSLFLKDEAQPLEERIRYLENMSRATADCTEEAYSLYFHCNPEKYGSNMDFFYIRSSETGAFVKDTALNPFAYQNTTGFDADWYFASASTNEACWLPPYVQHSGVNTEDVIVTSYTTPLFDANGELLGVLGMDYSFEGLSEILEGISLYDTGRAFLIRADGTLVSDEDIPFDMPVNDHTERLKSVIGMMEQGENPGVLFRSRSRGEEQRLTFSALRNGTYLMVTVPAAEINASVDRMARESYILFAVVMISSVMIIYCIIYKFIRPLQLLTYASQQIIKGNMQVELPYHASDEIGELTENFRKMEMYLQEHISKINALAHTDAMTGLKNKASYQAAVSLLEERMRQGFTEFAVVVFDLNNLKHTNDTLGHAAGDRLIKSAGQIICKAFSHSPVFRIGGDEFVAILENDDLRYFQDCADRLERLNREVNEESKPEERVSIAYGMAQYEAARDENYRDVFSRADKEMYRHKLAIKHGEQ